MPIPSPNSGEERNEFISRCIGELYDEYGQEQAAGICYSVAEIKKSSQFKNLLQVNLPTLQIIRRRCPILCLVV